MKKRLLVLVILVLSVMLLAGCSGNGVVPPPPQEAEKFVGFWVNENQLSPDITKCRIELNNYLVIETWAACGGGDCYWGKLFVDPNITNGTLELVWEGISGFGVYKQKLTLVNQRLEIETTFWPYNPTSPEIKVTEYFTKS